MPSTSTIPLSSYQYIFDRRRSSHPWEQAIDRLQSSAVPGHPELAANWRMDFRVDDSRENQLVGSGCFPSAAYSPDFVKAVSDYFSYHQCRHAGVTSGPDYASTENSVNLIPVSERPARNHYLLHFASLKSLLQFVLRASNPNRVDFQIQLSDLTGERPIATAATAEVDRLADTLNAIGTDAVKSFARIVSDALGENEPLWWAAFAHEVRNFSATEDWTAAVRVLGLGHFEVGERLLAWRYSPEKAGRLFRPTVAEARDNGFHFPSPPMTAYGITMPLSDGLVAVRELVHSPIKGDACFDACTGMIGRIVSLPVPVADLSHFGRWYGERRTKHRAYLLRHNPSNITQNWLTRHAGLP
jgi:hypothetical protein